MVDTVTFSGTFALTGEADTSDTANGDLEFFNLFFCISVTANLYYINGSLASGDEDIVVLWKSTAGNDGKDSTGVFDDNRPLYPNGNTLVVGDGTPSVSYEDSLAVDAVGDWINDFSFLLTEQLDPNTNQILLNVEAVAQLQNSASVADLGGNYTLALGDFPPVPVVVASNVTATKGQVFAAASLFTAGDPDGDAITQYNFWDSGSGGAHFTVGSQVEPSQQTIPVSASQLTQTSYHSGSGADVVWVQASDGSQWSAWVSFTVTAPVDTPPVVTASSQGAVTGEVFSAASLVSARDPDGDSIAAYNFWDTGSGGAFFAVGSQVEGAKQNITLSPAQFAQTSYHSGSGPDVIWIQASDGTQWSPWVSFTVTGGVNTPPTVTVRSVTATHGETFAAASLVSASDPDGDAIASFNLWDSGTGGAYFLLNGQVQGTKQNITVSPTQLAQTTYQSGSGADLIWVQASDGTQWSPWVSFTVTGPVPTPPVVAVSDLTAAKGQVFAASSLASASDPDGDAVASYNFWDAGNGGAHFLLNNVAQPLQQNITVSAAQLAQTTYQSGYGTDVIWVQAFDGTQWSDWVSFTVVGPVDTPPIVSASDRTAKNGAILTASSLVSASDPDGDAIALYNLWDTGTDGAHLLLNGQVQGIKQNITLTPAQFAQTTYQAGSGPDVIWAQANDGTEWGPWVSFTVTGGIDAPPAVQSMNIETVAGQLFPGTVVSASDPDGDTIIGYNFWETGNGGAQLLLNGTPQPNQQNIPVAASQLGEFAYEAGTGSDTLWVQAADGTLWSAWAQLDFTSINPATIAAGATLDLASTYSGGVTFAASTGTLQLENSASFHGTVTAFSGHDTIDFADIQSAFVHVPSFSGTSSGGTLTVTDGTHSAAIALAGDYTLSRFLPSNDGHGGTVVSVMTPSAHPETLAPTVPASSAGDSVASFNDPSGAAGTMMGLACAAAGLSATGGFSVSNSSGMLSIGEGTLGAGSMFSESNPAAQLVPSSDAIAL